MDESLESTEQGVEQERNCFLATTAFAAPQTLSFQPSFFNPSVNLPCNTNLTPSNLMLTTTETLQATKSKPRIRSNSSRNRNNLSSYTNVEFEKRGFGQLWFSVNVVFHKCELPQSASVPQQPQSQAIRCNSPASAHQLARIADEEEPSDELNLMMESEQPPFPVEVLRDPE